MDGQHTVSYVDGLHIIEDVCLAIHPADSDHQLLAHGGTLAPAGDGLDRDSPGENKARLPGRA